MGSWSQGKPPFSFKEIILGERVEPNRKRGGEISANNEIKETKMSGLLNHALSLPGNHCAAWCWLYHCGTYQRRKAESLGNGAAMATERSTHDVKAHRGLAGGGREKSNLQLQLRYLLVNQGIEQTTKGSWIVFYSTQQQQQQLGHLQHQGASQNRGGSNSSVDLLFCLH